MRANTGIRLLKLRVCDHPNPTRQRGIVFLPFRSDSENPSLTLRVVVEATRFGIVPQAGRKK